MMMLECVVAGKTLETKDGVLSLCLQPYVLLVKLCENL